MHAIRNLVLDAHTLVTHRRMPPAGAARFASDIEAQAALILSGTAIAPDALAVLRPLLASVTEGADAVAGRTPGRDPIDGLIAIDEALRRYPERFDDPEWRPLR